VICIKERLLPAVDAEPADGFKELVLLLGIPVTAYEFV
jgi:hypothetical protein